VQAVLDVTPLHADAGVAVPGCAASCIARAFAATMPTEARIGVVVLVDAVRGVGALVGICGALIVAPKALPVLVRIWGRRPGARYAPICPATTNPRPLRRWRA
jgi:hypothetical protein